MPPVLSRLNLKGHEASRLTCCALCYCEKGHKASRPISEKDAELIREKVSEHFLLQDYRFGKALCQTCHLNLHNKNLKKGQLYISEKFGEKVRRSPAGGCQCTLCLRAALSGAAWLLFRRSFNAKFKPNRPSSGRTPGSARAPGVAKGRGRGRVPGLALSHGPAPGHAGHVGHAADNAAGDGPGHADVAGDGPGHADVAGHADLAVDGPGHADVADHDDDAGHAHAGPDPSPELGPGGRRGWSGPGKPNRLCPNCLTEVRLVKLNIAKLNIKRSCLNIHTLSGQINERSACLCLCFSNFVLKLRQSPDTIIILTHIHPEQDNIDNINFSCIVDVDIARKTVGVEKCWLKI